MKAKRSPYIILTCEHADYQIPKFVKSPIPKTYSLKELELKHQAYDKYALSLTENLKLNLKNLNIDCDFVSYPFTRLLIDANRTKTNKGFYGPLSKFLKPEELKKLENEYDKYVTQTKKLIQKKLNFHNVYIFSVHSFTPVFKQKKRKTEIGLLFRKTIKKELELATKLKQQIKNLDHSVHTHFNLPYRGHTDCFLNHILNDYKKNINVNGLFFEFNQNLLKSNLLKTNLILSQSLKDIL